MIFNNQYIQERIKKADTLREEGINPYPNQIAKGTPSKTFLEEEIYVKLVSLSLTVPQTSLLEKQLKPPVIYIPRVLTQQDLLAFEGYTIEDFHVKLIHVDPLINPAGKKFISAIKSTVELVTALTGGTLDINTSYNNSGRLSSFDMTSEHLKFSSQRKPD